MKESVSSKTSIWSDADVSAKLDYVAEAIEKGVTVDSDALWVRDAAERLRLLERLRAEAAGCEHCSEALGRPAVETTGGTPRVFVDMDGVIADFDRLKTERGMTGDELKRVENAFLDMQPIPGAIEGVRSLIGMGFEVWIATKPPTGIPHAYADKAAWILRHLPELKRRIVVTHDKGMLGCADDFLIDDRPHKANCERFRGTLIRFGLQWNMFWPEVLDHFRNRVLAVKTGEAHCGCGQCDTVTHASDCAVHLAPAMTPLGCNCGASPRREE